VPPWTGPSIDTFITPFGKYDLLAWMNKYVFSDAYDYTYLRSMLISTRYWINQGAPNHYLWAHEFSKHATCYSTFDLPCYGPDMPEHYDVLDFFQTTIHYFRQHPTYDWLAAANIHPSNTTSYSLEDIQWTLRLATGATPYLGCTGPKFNETQAGKGSMDDGHTVLDEVWYYMHVLGRPQDMRSIPVDASIAGSDTTCATSRGAIWYFERALGSEKP
jgi:ribonuclease T2